ncbi:MAG TPA: hypothetical protein VI298_01245 [Geobacteraceae bacterium]
MLHVVQVVMWGVAEAPRLFPDEAKARAAYVECAGRHWAQRYAAYCEHHGASGESFASAQAFVATIDASEKSTINYWTLSPEEVGLEEWKNPLRGPGVEEFQHVAKDIVAVREGLARLLDDVSLLTDRCARMDGAPAEPQAGGEPDTTALPPAAAPEATQEADPATYTTQEWQNFAGMIRRVCCGSRNQADLLPRDDWRQDVYGSRTSLEYWDWVADRIRKYKEKAQGAGYAVVEDPAAPGSYRFTNRHGIASEDRYHSEWEAWCAAGLHLEGGTPAA